MHLSMLCPTTMNTGEVGDRWGFVTFARKQRDSQYNCDAKGGMYAQQVLTTTIAVIWLCGLGIFVCPLKSINANR